MNKPKFSSAGFETSINWNQMQKKMLNKRFFKIRMYFYKKNKKKFGSAINGDEMNSHRLSFFLSFSLRSTHIEKASFIL